MADEFSSTDIVLVCGNYNSGKTTIAKKYFGQRMRINRNEIRRFLKHMSSHGEKWTPSDYNAETGPLVKHIEFAVMRDFLGRNKKIVIDNTSLTRESRKRYLVEAKNLKKTIGCLFVQVPIEELISRNRTRSEEERVPERVLVDLYSKTEPPTSAEGFAVVRRISGTANGD